MSGGSAALSDSRPSQASVSYTIDFDNVTTSATKCIQVVFSDAATGGSAPVGIGTTAAAFGGTSDYVPTPGSWSVNATTNGTVKITYATGETPASATDRTVVLTGITNGSTNNDDYFVQFSTFGNVDCATSALDTGTVAFIYTAGQAVSITVDPSISFTVNAVGSGSSVNGALTTVTSTATTIPLGTVTASTNAIAAHDLTVTTNAGSGYTIYTKYSAVPTNATSNTIDDITPANAAPGSFTSAGTEGFGYTTNDGVLGTGTTGRFTATGGNKWSKFTTSNLEVAYSAAAVSSETTRVGYQVSIAGTTEAGAYTNTVVLTATPTY